MRTKKKNQKCAGNTLFATTTLGLTVLFCLIGTGCATQSSSLMPNARTTQGEEMLVGETTLEAFWDQFPDWEESKRQYAPEKNAIEALQKIEREISMVLFLGTWCGDSRREVPKLLKVYEAAANSHFSLRIYGVDWEKKDDEGAAQMHQIERVPTAILFENGKEIGRIIENPDQTWEEDISKILES
jgi:thiol-disulfide isomerase/thioredoxin